MNDKSLAEYLRIIGASEFTLKIQEYLSKGDVEGFKSYIRENFFGGQDSPDPDEVINEILDIHLRVVSLCKCVDTVVMVAESYKNAVSKRNWIIAVLVLAFFLLALAFAGEMSRRV